MKKTSIKKPRVTVSKILESAAMTKLSKAATQKSMLKTTNEASESAPVQEASISAATALLVSAMADPRALPSISGIKIPLYEYRFFIIF